MMFCPSIMMRVSFGDSSLTNFEVERYDPTNPAHAASWRSPAVFRKLLGVRRRHAVARPGGLSYNLPTPGANPEQIAMYLKIRAGHPVAGCRQNNDVSEVAVLDHAGEGAASVYLLDT